MAVKRFGKFVPKHLIRARIRKRFGKFRRVTHGCAGKGRDYYKD